VYQLDNLIANRTVLVISTIPLYLILKKTAFSKNSAINLAILTLLANCLLLMSHYIDPFYPKTWESADIALRVFVSEFIMYFTVVLILWLAAHYKEIPTVKRFLGKEIPKRP